MQLSPAQQKTYLAFKDRESAEKYKLQCLVFNAQQNPVKRTQQKAVKDVIKTPKPPKPPKPEARPYTERGLLDNWEYETKQFKLIKKACSELKVGDIFQATVEPYFCEVVEILFDKFLPGYRLIHLKLLPDGLTGEAYIQLNRVVWVKE